MKKNSLFSIATLLPFIVMADIPPYDGNPPLISSLHKVNLFPWVWIIVLALAVLIFIYAYKSIKTKS